MRLRRCLCLVLLCAVTCCGLFSVSTYADEYNLYSYNGLIAPAFFWQDFVYPNVVILESDGSYYTRFYSDAKTRCTDKGVMEVWNGGQVLIDGVWVNYYDGIINGKLIWSNYDVYTTSGSLYLAASEPVLYVPPAPPPEPIGPSDIDSILDAFTDQISVQLVVIVLAAAAGVSVGLVFLWWGSRKVTGALMKAFKKGKIRI